MRYTTLLFLALLSLTVSAQVADPTRPADAPPADGLSAQNNGLNLQTIIVHPGKGRSTALIAGQVVRLGSRLGDKRVTKITEDEVVLQGDHGREVLRLTPSIQKKPVAKSHAATHHVQQPLTGTPRK